MSLNAQPIQKYALVKAMLIVPLVEDVPRRSSIGFCLAV
jgi:hypothetical protein